MGLVVNRGDDNGAVLLGTLCTTLHALRRCNGKGSGHRLTSVLTRGLC